MEQAARIQNNRTSNKSLHWFQVYAVKDRVVCGNSLSDGPQKSLSNLHMKEFLPTAEVHANLINDFTFFIKRILIQYLPVYHDIFSKAVTYHIPHTHMAEMAKKSEVVCTAFNT